MPASIQHGRSANHTLRIVCPNGHLGFAPIKTGSFRIGCYCEPDLICADSGSCDVGPVPLGADISSSPRQWQVEDLEEMLLAYQRHWREMERSVIIRPINAARARDLGLISRPITEPPPIPDSTHEDRRTLAPRTFAYARAGLQQQRR
jgi:hypothetical protein